MLDTALEALKYNKATEPRKEWITSEIIIMIDEVRKFKNASTPKHKLKYRELRNLIIRKSKEEMKAYIAYDAYEAEMQHINQLKISMKISMKDQSSLDKKKIMKMKWIII